MKKTTGPLGELSASGHDARGRFTAFNLDAMTTGVRSLQVRQHVIDNARAALKADRDALIADQGGPENVSTIKANLIERFLETTLIAEWLGGNLLVEGPLTGKGRQRAATTAYLQVLDRLHRLATALGLARVPKAAPDLATYLREHYGPTRPGQEVAIAAGDSHAEGTDDKAAMGNVARPAGSLTEEDNGQ